MLTKEVMDHTMLKPLTYGLLFIFSALNTGCSRDAHVAQGYIEGRYTYMTTSVSGVLKQLLVERGTIVNQGQLLFVLDEQPENYAYVAAQNNLKETIDARNSINANLTYAKLTFERDQTLVQKKVLQQSTLDNAKATYNATLAQLAQANANIAQQTAVLEEAQWTKEQKKIYAPVNAQVFDIYYRLGEYTLANQAILSLLAPGDIKAIFFVPEKELARVKLGNKIRIACDGCRQTYDGKITFIAPNAEYTPPVIYSTETNIKLIYRIEAEFAPPIASQLHPGQPIYVTYHAN